MIHRYLVYLLYTAVDISEVGVDFFDDFAVERYSQMQYAVRSRVLRSEVYDEISFVEYRLTLFVDVFQVEHKQIFQ